MTSVFNCINLALTEKSGLNMTLRAHEIQNETKNSHI